MKRQGFRARLVSIAQLTWMTAVILFILFLGLGCVPANIDNEILISPTIPPATATLTTTPASTPSPVPALTFEPTPAPTACKQTRGITRVVNIPSKLLKEDLRVTIYLPPCFPTNAPHDGYPVLYLLHGQAMNDGVWEELGWMSAADRLITAGEIEPLVMVMPLEKRELQSPQESKFEDVILNEVIPWMEDSYSVCRQPECRDVGGISRGAAWAIHIGLQHPGLFGSIGAHSLAYFNGDDRAVVRWIKKFEPGQMPRIWLDMGEKDRYRYSYETFVDVLNNLALPLVENTYPGRHDLKYWSEHTEEYLRWYAGIQPGGLD